MQQSVHVSVLLLTYNQELFISRCVDSVLSQKVNFTYEIIIGEDLGPDSTRKICQEYADAHNNIVLLPRTKNLGVTMNWVDCVKHAKGKYLMMLDGDDYWQNPDKMQIQVDFMERHPECVICHTDVDILKNNSNKLIKNSKAAKNIVPPEGMIQKDIISGKEHITSSSMCLRTDTVLEKIPFDVYEKESFPCEDWPTIAILAAYGEIRYIPISTTTYRIGQESVTKMKDYSRIRDYWQRSSNMTRVIHNMFPEDLGPFTDEKYFEEYVYHSLLNAAYDNNDYRSAKEFSKKDPKGGNASKMASTWLSFQIFRFYRFLKS